ncbi:MAG: TraB/GumN family protein [Phycisphaerales bacterium]|nr:TraB/GumN family protein [Hyphomonadaceae bacterium]
MRSLLTALLAAALSLSACSPPAQQGEPAIWRIADADSEVWLYGTVHLLPPDLRWRGPRMEAAFAAAEELVTETDTSAASMQATAQLVQELGALPPGERLSDRLSAGEAERLAEQARALGLDPAALERQRPWLAALQLSYAAVTRAGHRAEAGVETVLIAEAHTRSMPQSFLETPEQQIRILADLTPADQVRFLSATLREIDAGDETLAAMDAAWARGDVGELERLLAPQWQAAGRGIHEAVILNRNRDWADQIAARLEGSGRVFIAVGAAHLVGEDSVVDLLRARGIAVEGP